MSLPPRKPPEALPRLVGAGVAWVFSHPPRRPHLGNPRSALGIPYRRVRLRTRDNVRLSAWYVPAPESSAAKGVVMVCHGYFGNRGTMLPYVRFLHRAGYACVLFDFRAHGWSGGRQATFGLSELRDLEAAIDWVDSEADVRNAPLAVLGESMGGSVALMAAAQDTRVKAVVADSAFSRFDRAVEGRLKLAFGAAATEALLPHVTRFGERLLGCPVTEIAPEKAMRHIAPRPALLIHGARDRMIPVENAHRLYRAAGQTAAQLWEVPEAGHCGAVYVAKKEYARRVTAFLGDALGG